MQRRLSLVRVQKMNIIMNDAMCWGSMCEDHAVATLYQWYAM